MTTAGGSDKQFGEVEVNDWMAYKIQRGGWAT